MFYTAYGDGGGGTRTVFLNLATTADATRSDGAPQRPPCAAGVHAHVTAEGWRRWGRVFPSQPGSKSAALLLRDPPPHYLLWGSSDIRIAQVREGRAVSVSSSTLLGAQSFDATSWPDIGDVIISPRPREFDSMLVESGPPPLRLSTGDYLFFYNSASSGWPATGGYHPAWVILNGSDPTQILQRASEVCMCADACVCVLVLGLTSFVAASLTGPGVRGW